MSGRWFIFWAFFFFWCTCGKCAACFFLFGSIINNYTQRGESTACQNVTFSLFSIRFDHCLNHCSVYYQTYGTCGFYITFCGLYFPFIPFPGWSVTISLLVRFSEKTLKKSTNIADIYSLVLYTHVARLKDNSMFATFATNELWTPVIFFSLALADSCPWIVPLHWTLTLIILT